MVLGFLALTGVALLTFTFLTPEMEPLAPTGEQRSFLTDQPKGAQVRVDAATDEGRSALGSEDQEAEETGEVLEQAPLGSSPPSSSGEVSSPTPPAKPKAPTHTKRPVSRTGGSPVSASPQGDDGIFDERY
jgi:hypothetical protein